MIPCIKNKCLLLPICKSRQTIECHYLVDFYEQIEFTYYPDQITSDFIRPTLPKAKFIKDGQYFIRLPGAEGDMCDIKGYKLPIANVQINSALCKG